jgi:hypothetical protein
MEQLTRQESFLCVWIGFDLLAGYSTEKRRGECRREEEHREVK